MKIYDCYKVLGRYYKIIGKRDSHYKKNSDYEVIEVDARNTALRVTTISIDLLNNPFEPYYYSKIKPEIYDNKFINVFQRIKKMNKRQRK